MEMAPKVLTLRGAKIVAPRRAGWGEVIGVRDSRFVRWDNTSLHKGTEHLVRDEMFVLPGFVDLHVHFDEPGRTDWEGIERGSIKAILGGVTSVVDMPIDSYPPTVSSKDVLEKIRLFEDKSFSNFGVLSGALPGRTSDMVSAVESGAVGFKGFMSPSGWPDFPPLDTSALEVAMKIASSLGMRIAIHAEDPSLFDDTATGEHRRPIVSETSAVSSVLRASSEFGAKVHLVHLSSSEAVRMVNNSNLATAESCPHYFLSDRLLEHFGLRDVTVQPPVRDRDQRRELRDLVHSGWLDAIASDHSPGPPDSPDDWAGASGVGKTMLALLDEFDSLELVSRYTASAASVFDLDATGEISVGNYADFVVVFKDNDDHWKVSDVVVGGHLVVCQGELMGRPPVSNLADRIR